MNIATDPQAILARLPATHRAALTTSTELFPQLHQVGDAGLPLLTVDNALGRAAIAQQGAQVLAFQPRGQREMLWISPQCVLTDGQPIRGGIPLCLPWFGPGPDGKSMHGFARTTPWLLTAAEAADNGATRLVFALAGGKETSALWPQAFAFELEITVGSTLQMQLRARNTGDDPAPFAFAFHTYFAVPDVAASRVAGLAGCTYIDKVDAGSRKTQAGDVCITAMTDRVYLDVPTRQSLLGKDAAIHIDSDTRCAIVWNAWANADNMPDIGAGNHVGYLCVERGDVAEYAVTLPAGGEHRMQMTLSF